MSSAFDEFSPRLVSLFSLLGRVLVVSLFGVYIVAWKIRGQGRIHTTFTRESIHRRASCGTLTLRLIHDTLRTWNTNELRTTEALAALRALHVASRAATCGNTGARHASATAYSVSRAMAKPKTQWPKSSAAMPFVDPAESRWYRSWIS